jgi:hypothetical protein
MARLCKDGYLIQSLRNSDFDCYSAYGEVIDNSIQANAKNIHIEFETISRGVGRNQKEVINKMIFFDDGIGMSPDILENCLTLGYSSRYNDRSGIGRFGVGATLAALHECTDINVYSKSINSDWHNVSVEVAQKNGNPDPENQKDISEPNKIQLPQEYKSFNKYETGTIVVWSNHDRNELNGSDVIEETKVWIGRTFRKFIWKGIKIFVNGEEIKAIDPLYVTTEKTNFPADPKAYEYETSKISWPVHESGNFDEAEKEIQIRTSLLPKELRKKRGSGGSKESQQRHIDENEGISIIRNDREVFYGIPANWPKGGVNFGGNTEYNRWWGCEISFNACHDTSFTVKNIKRGAQPVIELRRAINDRIKGIVKQCIEQVQDDWSENDRIEVENQQNNTQTFTGHETAENVAKNTATEANQLTKGRDKNELIKDAADKLLTDKQKQIRAEWESKFEAQPFTIIDGDWRGTEFVQVNHTATGAVLKYNIRHNFHKEIIKLQTIIEESIDHSETKKAAKDLKALIDLLLISYCKSELSFDNTAEMSPEDLVEDLRMNWGRFLERYIKKLNG